jgi:hypothetical protein
LYPANIFQVFLSDITLVFLPQEGKSGVKIEKDYRTESFIHQRP